MRRRSALSRNSDRVPDAGRNPEARARVVGAVVTGAYAVSRLLGTTVMREFMSETSPDPFYEWMDHTQVRDIVHRANELTPGERLVLLNGLVPGLVDALGPVGFRTLVDELCVMADRYHKARAGSE